MSPSSGSANWQCNRQISMHHFDLHRLYFLHVPYLPPDNLFENKVTNSCESSSYVRIQRSFSLNRELSSIEHSKILINISVCLICLYVVLLTSSTTVLCFTYSEVGCGILSALCHYFILVYFGWTFVEAFFLYRNLVKVLVPTIPNFVLKAALFVWRK